MAKTLREFLITSVLTDEVRAALETAHELLFKAGYRDMLTSAVATAEEIQEDIECFLVFQEAGVFAC